MRKWSLKAGDPLSLTLASDARLGPVDYYNDQIWELSLSGGEPQALSIWTTYGLRARSLQLFPSFIEDQSTCIDPASFTLPPTVQQIYPNFLILNYAPFTGIDVKAEYWVPESHAAAGRLTLTNSGNVPRKFKLEWNALLSPIDEGEHMAPTTLEAVAILAGCSGGIAPVVFVTGGAKAGYGPYPNLSIDIELAIGSSKTIIWTTAALSSLEESFVLARKIAARNWDAERAKLELLNAGLIDIHTGNPDWDAAFALSQKVAFSLLCGPTSFMPSLSFVSARKPDQGFSLRGDGKDYNHLWSGQTPLEALFLTGFILQPAPHLAKGLLVNFLNTTCESGFIDWKPGLGGQRSQLLATPVLTELAWKIYRATQDHDFIVQVFPSLLAFFDAWFAPERDRDGDGIPEWDHPLQSGLDDHPLFTHWHPWSQNADISVAESPGLCAFLYREGQRLIQMAELLQRTELVPALQTRISNLRTAVEISWDIESNIYRHWDRDSHFSTIGQHLGDRNGSGSIDIYQEFEQPVRVLVRVQAHGEATIKPHIFIHGTSPNGQHLVEHISENDFRWYLGAGSSTGKRTYSNIERVQIHGLEDDDQIALTSVNFVNEDILLLLPIWAGIPEAERIPALVSQTITAPQGFWKPFGLPACVGNPDGEADSECYSVQIPWNTLIGEGLLKHGYRQEAAALVQNLMQAVVQNLKQRGCFYKAYHPVTGNGMGEKNALEGLAPLELFLSVLGIHLDSPKQISIHGFNPFPWPVTVKYRGMSVLSQKDKVTVVFQDGQSITVDDPSPCIVKIDQT